MSIGAFIIIISSVIFFFSLYSMFNILGKNMLLTMPGIFYAFFIVFIYLGSPFYFLNAGMINIHYIASIHLVLIILPICIFITNKIMQVEFRYVFNSYLGTPILDKQAGNHFMVPFIFILLLTLGVTLAYYSNLEVIPINYLLFNLRDGFEINELGKLRESATTTFKMGKLHRYNIFMVQLLPLLVIVSFLKSKISENNIWKLIFLILTILTSYRCISDLQKGTIVDFIILLFLAACIYKGKIYWKQVVLLIFSIMALLSLIYYLLLDAHHDSFIKILVVIGKRVFFTQTGALYHYFSLFPSSHEFLYGTSLPNPAGLFQFDNFPLTKWIFINGMYRNSPIVGTANSAFIGELYANYGFLVMLSSVIIFSIMLQYVQIKFISKPRTLLLSSFYTYFVFLSSQFALTGLFVVAHLYLLIFLITAIIFVDGYTILYGVTKKNE